MLSVPVAVPSTAGANAAETSQCVPGAMTPRQRPLDGQWVCQRGNRLVMETLVSETPAEPVLVTWTFCAALVIPIAIEPNERLVGETEAAGVTPVPARLTA